MASKGHATEAYARTFFEGLLPSEAERKILLNQFVDSIILADRYGVNKWGVILHERRDRVWLMMGSVVIAAIVRDALTLSVVRTPAITALPQLPGRKYFMYQVIPGTEVYIHAELAELTPVVRNAHQEFVETAGKKYKQLRQDSQPRHSVGALAYLRNFLSRSVPSSSYW